MRKPKTMKENAGFIIKSLRKNQRMTQKQLADKVGITASAIAQYEAGQTFPRSDTLQAIGEALGADPMIFMTPVPDDFVDRLNEGGFDIDINEAFEGAGFTMDDTFEPVAELLYDSVEEVRDIKKSMSRLSANEKEISAGILKHILEIYSVLKIEGQLELLKYAFEIEKDSRYSEIQELFERAQKQIEKKKSKEE